MKVDIDFIQSICNNDIINVIQVPKGHNIYEFAIQVFKEGAVFGCIELEGEIVDKWDCIIGYFGSDFNNRLFVYYLL